MNPWLIVAAIGACILSAWLGFKQGAKAERADWLAKENTELALANEKIITLTNKVHQQEADHAKALSDIARDRERDRLNAESRRARDVDAARSGAIRLLVSADACKARGSAAGEAGAPAAVRDGAETIELPRALTESLLNIANDADDVADQLRSCQAVIIADRKSQEEP